MRESTIYIWKSESEGWFIDFTKVDEAKKTIDSIPFSTIISVLEDSVRVGDHRLLDFVREHFRVKAFLSIDDQEELDRKSELEFQQLQNEEYYAKYIKPYLSYKIGSEGLMIEESKK